MDHSSETELLTPERSSYALLFQVLEASLEARSPPKVEACFALIDAVIAAASSPPTDAVLEQLVGFHERAWHLRSTVA